MFTPDIPVTENQNKLPVIVGFFGTNFTSETSRDDFYGADRFMQTGDVVLGFQDILFSGFQTQILALKWSSYLSKVLNISFIC